MKVKSKIITLVLSLVMIFALMPTVGYATDGTENSDIEVRVHNETILPITDIKATVANSTIRKSLPDQFQNASTLTVVVEDGDISDEAKAEAEEENPRLTGCAEKDIEIFLYADSQQIMESLKKTINIELITENPDKYYFVLDESAFLFQERTRGSITIPLIRPMEFMVYSVCNM